LLTTGALVCQFPLKAAAGNIVKANAKSMRYNARGFMGTLARFLSSRPFSAETRPEL
jgi:hypothetical protein